MKNFLCLLALCYLAASCIVSQEINPSLPIDVVDPSGAYREVYAPQEFKVQIQATNYSPKQKEKLDKAQELIAKIFNSEEYKREVLVRKFTYTELSGQEVYEKLIQGAEKLRPIVDWKMDLKVEMYFKRLTKVVGYTLPGSLIVYTNSKFHDRYSVCEVASNLVHEWTHKMGFDHSSAQDKLSVPYAHNEIIEALCPHYI